MASIRKDRGAWLIDYRDRRGKRHRERYRTKKAADVALAEMQVQIQKNTFRPDGRRIRFQEYAERWIANRKSDLRAGTWQTYNGQIRDYLLSAEYGLGPFKLSEVDLPTVNDFRAKLIERCRRLDGMTRADAPKGTLSDRSINAVLTLLGTILESALREGYLSLNPARHIDKLPRLKSEAIPLDVESGEVQKALQGAQEISEDFYLMVLISVLAGMRRGELLALRWFNFDFERNLIHVGDNYTRAGFGETKTKSGFRSVDMAPQLAAPLREHRLRKGNPAPDALVFDAGKGKPMHPDTVSGTLWARLRRSQDLAGMSPTMGTPRPVTWHSLRHTFASLLIAQGEHPRYIMEQMGHSSIEVTMNVYGHLLPSTGKRAAEKLGETVLGTKWAHEPVTGPAKEEAPLLNRCNEAS